MYKQLSKSFIFLFLALLVFLCFGSFVYAVDGVIEINQPRALVGGVTPGDAAGFPVTISEVGSYRLTGNLSVGSTDAIEITTDNVTLDLNGFSIIGPGCGSGTGVLASSGNVVVVNGTVRGMGNHGISAGQNSHVEKVHAISNGGVGISVGINSIASSNVAIANFNGITGGNNGTISNNVASKNSTHGIFAGSCNTVSGNVARENGKNGISAGLSVITGNTASLNGENGILAGNGSIVTRNTAFLNGHNGISASSSMVLGNTAVKNTQFGLMAIDYTGYADNNFYCNVGGEVSGGIEIGTNLCGGDTTCP